MPSSLPKILPVLLAALVLLPAGLAQARVFNFKNEFFAAYLRTTAGASGVGGSAFADSSGASTKITDSVSYDFGGEIGFMFSIEEMVNFRIGMELIQPKTVSQGEGFNTGGTKLFDLKSTILVINPTATIEYNFLNTPTSRFFVYGGAGIADVTIDNQYTMTAAGIAEPEIGVPDHTEKMEADLLSGHGGVGYEMLMTDNVTVAFDLGYRYLRVSGLKYKSDVTAITNNTATKGTKVINNNGKARKVSMSSPFIGINFRFYIPIFQ